MLTNNVLYHSWFVNGKHNGLSDDVWGHGDELKVKAYKTILMIYIDPS